MPSRTRSIDRPKPTQGIRYAQFSNQTPVTTIQGAVARYDHRLMNDVVNMRHLENPLSLQISDKRGMIPYNGAYNGGPTGWKLEITNWHPTALLGVMGHQAYSNISDGELATLAISRSNPSKPVVSIPNFLFEMKDLPRMFRDIGNLKIQLKNLKRGRVSTKQFARISSSHYLAATFGWAPLINDLRQLLNFQADVDKRIDVLDRLFNKNEGLHRTIGKPNKNRNGGLPPFAVSVESTVNSFQMESSFPSVGVLTAKQQNFTTSTKWASVRWKATSLPSTRYSNKELQKMARDLVYGKNITPETIWNALPWSWLIDWFVNTGAFVSAGSNSIPVRAETPCIMEHVVTRRSYVPNNYPSWLLGGDGWTVYETKERRIVGPTLTARFGFLSPKQLSILGALAIQRRR